MQPEQKQTIIIENRRILTIDNVLNIDNFTEEYLEISSKSGQISVEGKCLKIEELRQDSGKITIIGEINGVFYHEEKNNKRIFGKIFK